MASPCSIIWNICNVSLMIPFSAGRFFMPNVLVTILAYPYNKLI
jgi:hypothetical protein